ncbi:hypothetical protein FACS189497_13040 [Betaproteobacteria bacterium]|nr:hypothetical protein FACS189497_13040 [Betaproteobacteria bacterium]
MARPRYRSPIWSIILIGSIFIAEILFYFWKQSIIIDKDGIGFHDFPFGRMEAYYEWRELVQIRRTTLLPVWFGTAQQDTFFIAKYNTNKNQYWRSVSAPRSVYFQLRLDRENQKYSQPGTEHDFTVYHGIFGLKSIHIKEMEALQYP